MAKSWREIKKTKKKIKKTPETHWNHRVVKRKDRGEVCWGLHEVFYENDKPTMVTTTPVSIETSTEFDGPPDSIQALKNLRDTLERMLAALDKPILDYDNIPEK